MKLGYSQVIPSSRCKPTLMRPQVVEPKKKKIYEFHSLDYEYIAFGVSNYKLEKLIFFFTLKMVFEYKT